MESLSIAHTAISEFKIPFHKPFTIGGVLQTERQGFYVTLTLGNGITATSEIAPLPGFSQETLKKAHHDLQQVVAILPTISIQNEFLSLKVQLESDPRIFNLCASVRFGVESCIIALAAQASQTHLVDFLGGHPRSIAKAGLLQGSIDQIEPTVQQLIAQNIHVFKLKVGDRNIPLDVKKVQQLRSLISTGDLIRLDANGRWNFEEAVLFGSLIGPDAIEFIEEPINDVSRVGSFYQKTQIPVALDETMPVLRCGVNAPGRCSPTLAHQDAVSAFIIKPTMLGFCQSINWINEAKALHKKAVVSSCFETHVGQSVLNALACLSNDVAGLGTDAWLYA